MRMGKGASLLLAATALLAGLLAGCKGFWDAPSSSSFTLSNSGNMSVAPGATGTSTITVTPGSSYTGTVSLTCSITSTPTSATSATTCSLSSTSLTFSSSTAQTSTLTASTSSSTTVGSYGIKVTGTSGSDSESTSLCAQVTTGSDTCSSSTAGNSGRFYILNGSSITGYSISGGSLVAISGGSKTLTGATAYSIAIGPNGSFLFVGTNVGIVPFSVNTSTGALTEGTSFGDQNGEAIAVDPSGKWLLEASLAGGLYAYPITSTGATDSSRSAQTSVYLASNTVQPGGISISENGALVAVALGTTGTQIFPFNASSASPIGTAYSPTTKPYGGSGAAAVAVAIDPQSRLLYLGETNAFSSNTNSGALRVFTINSNSVSELGYSTPYAPLGTGPHAILPISNGNYVYVASWQSGSAGVISGYSVTTSGLTAAGSTVGTGTQPYGLVEDNSQSYALAVSYSGTTFSAFTTGSSAGQLTASLSSSPVSSPIAIAAAP